MPGAGPGPGADDREPLPVQGTVAGRAFASTSILELDGTTSGAVAALAPLIDGTERLGVAEMTFPVTPSPLPEALVALCERYAHLIATLITNKDLYSDFFKVLRRRRQ